MTTLQSPGKPQDHLPEGYRELLVRRRYSESTIKSYTNYFRQYMLYFRKQGLKSITCQQINSYILQLIKTKAISSSQQNQRINAIKFYYEKVLGRKREYYHVNRPNKEKNCQIF